MTVNKTRRVATVVLLLALAVPVSACGPGKAGAIREGWKGVKEIVYGTGLFGLGGVGCKYIGLCWVRNRDGTAGVQPPQGLSLITKGVAKIDQNVAGQRPSWSKSTDLSVGDVAVSRTPNRMHRALGEDHSSLCTRWVSKHQ